MTEPGPKTSIAPDIGNPALRHVQEFVDDSPAPVNPLQIIRRLLRGRWVLLFILAPLTGFVLATLTYLSIDQVYQSQGLVRPVAKERKILYADNDDSRLRLYDAFVSSEATYLQSQRVLRRAHEILVDRLDKRGLQYKGLTFKALADATSVKKLKGLIAVQASNPSPQIAKLMVNAVLDGYLDLQSRQSDTRQTLRARELEARVQELVTKQSGLSQALLDIGEEYDASSLAKAHLTKVTQLEELSARIDELSNALVEMEAADGALDADTGDMEIKRATLLDRAMADMVFERAKRAAELEKLLLRYQKSHPKVATLSASLDVIDEAIETRRRLIATLGKTGAITGTDGASKTQSMDELRALKKKLTVRRAELSAEAKVLNGKLIQLRRINAEQAQISGMLAETRRILDQVLLESRNSLPGIIEILSRGSTPGQPHKDKRKQFAILSFLVGSGLIAIWLLSQRMLDPRLTYSDDLETLISPRTAVTVFEKTGQRMVAAKFLSDLQVHADWSHDRTNIVTLTRFSGGVTIPLDVIAEEAARQSMRTLILCASPEEGANDPGFIEAIKSGDQLKQRSQKGYDFIGYGQRSKDCGFSVQAVRSWLQDIAPDYDLVLIYCGIAEQHYATRILPKLADISVAALGVGDEKRLFRRFVSTGDVSTVLFVGARPDDPGLVYQQPPESQPKGESYDKAA